MLDDSMHNFIAAGRRTELVTKRNTTKPSCTNYGTIWHPDQQNAHRNRQRPAGISSGIASRRHGLTLQNQELCWFFATLPGEMDKHSD